MAAFQIETLGRKREVEDRKSETPMQGATNMHTAPSGFRPTPNPRRVRPSKALYDVTLKYRFNEYWTAGVPFGGPGPDLTFGSYQIEIGTPLTTTAVFYDLPSGNNYYDHEMWITVPATSPFAIQVDLSLEWSTWPGDVGTGTFFTGTCTLPAGGGFSNLLRIGPPAVGFKLTTFATTALTHTATITIL